METGSIIPVMAMFGSQVQEQISDLMKQTDIGCQQLTDEPGHRTMTGAGRLFTTADGYMTLLLAGHGFRDTNGHRPGLHGDNTVMIMRGHR